MKDAMLTRGGYVIDDVHNRVRCPPFFKRRSHELDIGPISLVGRVHNSVVFLGIGVIEAKANVGLLALIDALSDGFDHNLPQLAVTDAFIPPHWDADEIVHRIHAVHELRVANELRAQALFEFVEHAQRAPFVPVLERLYRARVEDLDIDPVRSLARKPRGEP